MKSTFRIDQSLRRDHLLKLLSGDVVETRGNPPGAAMIEGVACTRLADDLSVGECIAIRDALTRDVPDTYKDGFHISLFDAQGPVAGTTEWLAMIASNADRIPVSVLQPNGTRTDVMLSELTRDEQQSALKGWLATGKTPAWKPYVSPQPVISKYGGVSEVKFKVEGTRAVPVIEVLSGQALDNLGTPMGIKRAWGEPDATFRLRIIREMEASLTDERSVFDVRRKRCKFILSVHRAVLSLGAPELAATRTSPALLSSDAGEFIFSMQKRAEREEDITASMQSWFDDLYTHAKGVAKQIEHLVKVTEDA